MPTALDHSWRALTRPGLGESWFDADVAAPAAADAYDPLLAWWCAELSRLIYRHDGRDDILRRAGLREGVFHSRAGTHGAVVVPVDDAPDATSYLVFRGSSELRNWLTDFDTVTVAWPDGGRVHRGFVRALDRIWAELEPALDDAPGRVAFCGHSLGAALATVAAARRRPEALYTFGSPRVGTTDFGASLDDVAAHRIVNHHDLVTRVPPSTAPMKFAHVGELHTISAEQVHARVPRPFGGPPRPLADHAPVNYVALLQQRLSDADAT